MVLIRPRDSPLAAAAVRVHPLPLSSIGSFQRVVHPDLPRKLSPENEPRRAGDAWPCGCLPLARFAKPTAISLSPASKKFIGNTLCESGANAVTREQENAIQDCGSEVWPCANHRAQPHRAGTAGWRSPCRSTAKACCWRRHPRCGLATPSERARAARRAARSSACGRSERRVAIDPRLHSIAKRSRGVAAAFIFNVPCATRSTGATHRRLTGSSTIARV